jgi:uncharacterized membrane protein
MRQRLAGLLLLAMMAWPVSLAAAVAVRQAGAVPRWTSALYAVASRICHQRPERSFFTGAVQWPVCGRCSGLYLAAPFGAGLALLARRGGTDARRARWLAAVASLPTLVTFVLEISGATHVPNLTRAAAAVPLGAAIGWLLMRAAVE